MFEKIDATSRQNIKIALVDPDQQLRSNIRQSLFYNGFKNIEEYGDIKKFRENLDKFVPDLLMIDFHTPEGNACDLVRSLRYNESGQNPFLSVIITVWQNRVESLDNIINSGADFIILKPMAPQAVFERMEALIDRRKPFICTSAYLGPDRRKDPRAGEDIPTFDVPNTLKIKSTGKNVDLSVIQKAIDQTMGQINEEMINRQAFQMVFQMQRFTTLIKNGEREAQFALKDLKRALVEMMRRIDSESHQQTVDLCLNLNTTLDTIAAAYPKVNARDLELVKTLTLGIYVGLKNTEGGSQDVLEKVNSAIANFERKRQLAAAAGKQ
jgi:DNA-binding response OmpR family regulator